MHSPDVLNPLTKNSRWPGDLGPFCYLEETDSTERNTSYTARFINPAPHENNYQIYDCNPDRRDNSYRHTHPSGEDSDRYSANSTRLSLAHDLLSARRSFQSAASV